MRGAALTSTVPPASPNLRPGPDSALVEVETGSTRPSSDQFNDSPADPMRSRTSPNRRATSRAAADRRQHVRLRDLCDEVLASFHAANGQDPISDQDRTAALELMKGVAPLQRLAAH